MPMSVGHNADGHRDYHKKYKYQFAMRLGQTANMPRPYGRCLAPIMPPSLGDNAQKVCTLMPMSVGRNADGHRDYHKKYKKPIRDEARADCQYASAISPMPRPHNAAEPWR